MARAPRTERPNTPPSGATDIGTYGITPVAALAPAALALGATPVLAADDGVPADAPAGGTPHVAPMTTTVEAQGGSPFAAALGPPTFLLDAAGSIASAMRAATPEPDRATLEGGEPAEQQDGPSAAGGSGTPPGLIQVDQSAPPAVPEPGTAGGVAGVTAPGGLGLQSSLDAVDARIEGMRVSIGEQLEEVTSRIDVIETEVGATITDVESTVSDTIDAASGRVAEISDAAAGLMGSLPEIDLGLVSGADPAGGISTLVGMVSAADMFGLHDIGVGGAGEMASPFMASAGDAGLAEFAPADVLLAVPDHDSAFGLLDGLIDGHHG